MKAVALSLQHLCRHVRNQSVLVFTDNTTVVAYIKRQGGTHSSSLCAQARSLLIWCRDQRITITVRHVAGKNNVLADSLSRKHTALPAEWCLNQTVVHQIFLALGQTMVDLFATRLNNRLPLYVAPNVDHSAWAVDALTLDWNGLEAYAFPPFILLPKVLQKIRSSACQITLIAPNWPQRSWFHNLLELLVDHPRRLPAREDLLTQANGNILHPNISMLDLHAWKLSGRESVRNSFHNRLPPISSNLVDSPLGKCTTLDGSSIEIGAVHGKWILSTPL